MKKLETGKFSFLSVGSQKSLGEKGECFRSRNIRENPAVFCGKSLNFARAKVKTELESDGEEP